MQCAGLHVWQQETGALHLPAPPDNHPTVTLLSPVCVHKNGNEELIRESAVKKIQSDNYIMDGVDGEHKPQHAYSA